MSKDSVFQKRLTQTARWSALAVICLTLVGTAVLTFRQVYQETAIAAASLLIFIFVQFFTERGIRLKNPPLMQLMITVLFFTSLTIGRFFNLYRTLPGFDKSQHLLYGIAFGILGVAVFYRLNPAQGRHLTVSPGTVFWFATAFGFLCGFAWEIFEFTMDRLFQTDMQFWQPGIANGAPSGLIDTMFDLAADLIGSAGAGMVCLSRLRRDPTRFFDHFFADFLPPEALTK